MAVETYVVSVYRRTDESGKEAAGLIERSGDGESKAFASCAELWAFLCGKRDPPATRSVRKARMNREP